MDLQTVAEERFGIPDEVGRQDSDLKITLNKTQQIKREDAIKAGHTALNIINFFAGHYYPVWVKYNTTPSTMTEVLLYSTVRIQNYQKEEDSTHSYCTDDRELSGTEALLQKYDRL